MTSTKESILLITAIIITPLLFFTFILPELLSPHIVACWELADHLDDFSPIECVQYIDANPGATGQDVVDYYINNNDIKELLDNPI